MLKKSGNLLRFQWSQEFTFEDKNPVGQHVGYYYAAQPW